jgi:hypothetical protein
MRRSGERKKKKSEGERRIVERRTQKSEIRSRSRKKSKVRSQKSEEKPSVVRQSGRATDPNDDTAHWTCLPAAAVPKSLDSARTHQHEYNNAATAKLRSV